MAVSEIDTKTETVELRAAFLAGLGFPEAAATLRALAGERDALREGREKERAAYERVIALKDERIAEHAEARDRAEAALTTARAEAARLREALKKIADADFNCTPRQYGMAMAACAEAALAGEPRHD
jgi:hypothetical protein